MQADLSIQHDRAFKAEAALTEAQTRAHQLSEAAQQARQEQAHAEQQVVELKAVEGQLEAEVARLQLQLEGVQGQLQVMALCRDHLQMPAVASSPALLSLSLHILCSALCPHSGFACARSYVSLNALLFCCCLCVLGLLL